jgi:hypothetical protein
MWHYSHALLRRVRTPLILFAYVNCAEEAKANQPWPKYISHPKPNNAPIKHPKQYKP